MSAFKRINNSDVIVSPYVANKQWSFNAYDFSSNDINIYFGTKISGSFDPNNEPISNNRYERLVYDSANHLYYQEFSGSYLNNSLNLHSIYYDSSSIYRASSSYYDYSIPNYTIKNFPSSSGSQIIVLSVPKDIFGISLDPGTFAISMSNLVIRDDGYQNLYDISLSTSSYSGSNSLYEGTYISSSNNIQIGNVFYSHGVAIITNQNYQNIFPKPPLAKNDFYTFYSTASNKITYPLLNDDPRGGVLLTGSLVLSGSTSDLSYWINNYDGTVTLNSSIPGEYTIYYNVQSENGCMILMSNTASINVNLLPVCGFNVELLDVPTTTTTTSTTTAAPTTTTTSTSTTTSTTTSVPTTTTTTSTTTSTTTAAPTTTTTTSTTTSTTTLGPNLYIVNDSSYSYTNFVAVVNGSNVSGLTAVSLPNSGFTRSGTTTSFVLGTNSLVLYSNPISGTEPISVFSITDYVTSAPISFTQQQSLSNPNETDISISGLLQSNITNGIRVQLQ